MGGYRPRRPRPAQHRGQRVATEAWRLPKAWLERVEAGSGERKRTPLAPGEQVEELLVMGLRLVDGIELSRIERLAGRPWHELLDRAALETFVTEGLLRLAGGRLAATAAGRQRLNGLLAALLIGPPDAAGTGSPRSPAR